jgi:hypothetical protein
MTGKRPIPPKLAVAGGAAALALLFAIVAIVRPGRPVLPPAPVAGAAAVDEHLLDVCVLKPVDRSRAFGDEGPCSRPASAAGVAAVAAADAAYDAGDFRAARKSYLGLLLAGVDFGDDSVETIRWCHGRLALCVAKLALPPGVVTVDEPPLLFEDGPR